MDKKYIGILISIGITAIIAVSLYVRRKRIKMFYDDCLSKTSEKDRSFIKSLGKEEIKDKLRYAK
ncbi:MAG: hypothetical protein P9M13_07515 [Candidatus Ancaeobacter aquaticus]|nr:hypothetical protein [Candidatus Ancaeobacter aquaticus]